MFGENMRTIRKRMELTLEDLEKKTGIIKQTLSRYERNEREPKISYAIRIAKELHTTVEAHAGEREQ